MGYQERGGHGEIDRGKDIPPSAIDLFVKPSEEKKFCEENGIELRRLENGATILGVNQRVEGVNHAEIDFVFPTGAANDPPNKTGIHHFIEHLVHANLYPLATKNYTDFNAATSASEIIARIRGTTNPQVRDYGLWNIISPTFEVLGNLPKSINDRMMKEQKGVILREMDERKSDQKLQLNTYFKEAFYDGSNLLRVDVGGKEEHVLSVTRKEADKFAPQIFASNGLNIAVFNQGDLGTMHGLLNELEDKTNTMLKPESKRQPVDRKLYSRLNPDFQLGSTYIKDVEYFQDTILLSYVWTFQESPYTTDSLAFPWFIYEANRKTFDFVRGSGLSYSPSVDDVSSSEYIFNPNKICLVQFPVKPQPNIDQYAKDLAKPLKEAVFGTMSDDEFKRVEQAKKIKLLAEGFSPQEKFGLQTFAINQTGRFMSTNELLNRHLEVGTDHLKKWRDRFLDTDPAIIIVGDLKK